METETPNRPPVYDPVAETKQKIVFTVVALAVLIASKFLLGW